jgi:serine/threonine protein kinase
MSSNQRPLDQYELQQCLKKDTTSELWKAFDTQQHRYVIISLLRFTLPPDEAFPRFIHETRGLVALRHPHLASVLEVKTFSRTASALGQKSEAFIVMDYVDGLSVAQYLQNQDQISNQDQILKRPSPVEILHILSSIGEAVDYIHQQGIIHGLIKPSSILLDKHNVSRSPLGEPKLIDLGLHNTYDPHQLSPNEVCYLAPEIIQGDTDNVRSDLYSLGVILYELCTATVPFHGTTTAEVINQQLNAMPPAPVLLNPSIGPALTAIIMRALAKNPSGRFPSAAVMISALAKALQISTPQASSLSDIEKSRDDAMHSPTLLSPSPQLDRPVFTNDSGTAPPLPSAAQGLVSNPPIRSAITPLITATHQPISNSPTPLSEIQNASLVSGSFQAVADRTPQGQMMPTLTSGPSGAKPTLIGSPTRRSKPRYLYVTLISLTVLVLIGASVSTKLLFFHYNTPQDTIVGHAFFISSGMMSLTSSSGITDELQIHLENVSPPLAGKSYYAWLLPDTNDETNSLPLTLGVLAVKNSQATLNYAGDANHTNLLSQYSRLLVTEEDAGTQPVNPSLNLADRRYSAAFSHVPNPQDTVNHFSLVDHLRHLLSQDPKLQKVGLVGGLDSWLYRNTLKVLEWAGSARDLALTNDNPALIRRQLLRILDYLDGSQFVQTENLPPDLATDPVLTDPTITRVALLEISPAQQPPGYLKHIGTHLSDITQAPGVSPAQQQLASEINSDINNVQVWLSAVHHDAAELIQQPADQIIQPQTLPIFNDLFVQANKAFTGQTDPHTGQVKAGVAQIYYSIQNLATFEITPCTKSNCVGGPF